MIETALQIDGKWAVLPDDTEKGLLEIKNSTIKSLSSNVVVPSLKISDSEIIDMESITVNDTLCIIDCKWQGYFCLKLEVGGSMTVGGNMVVPFAQEAVIKDYLDLREINGKIKLPDRLILGSDLIFPNGRTQVELPVELITNSSLSLEGWNKFCLPERLIVGGNLNLSNCKDIKKMPSELFVGGDLVLFGSDIESLPMNTVVYGDVYCTSLKQVYRLKNVRIGGSVKYQSWLHSIKPTEDIGFRLWKDSDKFIFIQNRLLEIIGYNNNLWKVKSITGAKPYYLATDNTGKYAKGNTEEEAIKNLTYIVTDRNRSRFKSFDKDSKLSYKEAIECYMVVTRSCSDGVRCFVENKLPEEYKKQTLTIKELADLTEGCFGNAEFKNFFKIK